MARIIFIYLMMLDTEEEKSKFEKVYFTYRQLMFQVANSILKDEYLAELLGLSEDSIKKRLQRANYISNSRTMVSLRFVNGQLGLV